MYLMNFESIAVSICPAAGRNFFSLFVRQFLLAQELSLKWCMWWSQCLTILIDSVTDSPSRENVSEFIGQLMSLQQATFYCNF